MYALVTGASSGIGQEFAKQLAKKKYDLILVARRLDRLQVLKQKLEKKYSITVICMCCDLSNREECFHLFDHCKNYPIELVINNAGFGKTGYFTQLSLEEELSMIETNVMAVHILTKLFSSHLQEGYILNVASIAAFSPIPVMATYGATKAYVLSLSRAVNYEMKLNHKNITVSSLCPGPVDTEFNHVAGTDFDLHSITARQCVREALSGLFKKKEIIVPSITTRLLRHLMPLAPSRILLPIEYKIQTKKLDQSKL